MIDITGLREDKRPQSSTIVHALLDRLEAAENDAAHQKALADSALRVAEGWEEKCNSLRSLVVMRFDHDHPPQFTQGYDTHELTEPVTAEHCRWFVAEITRLRAKIAEMERQEPVEWQARTRPTWNDGTWGQWSKCSEGYAQDIKKTPLLHDWLYEARALYALPGAKGDEK